MKKRNQINIAELLQQFLLAGLYGNESGCDSSQVLDNNENSGNNEAADEISR